MMYLYSNHIPTLIYDMLYATYTNITYLYMLVSIYYISYHVTGLNRLGKTCYLHSLLCKMILFQFAHGKMITQPTLTPPQTRDW